MEHQPKGNGMRKVIGGTMFLLSVLAGLALPSAASAATPDGNCRTSVATINNRADRGFGTENDAVWAYKHLTRTTKVCQVVPDVQVLSELKRWDYQATVTDVGTFETVAGDHLSPEAGGPLVGGVEGTFKGGFTARFSAAANFHDYNAVHDKNTYNAEKPGNQDWVRLLFDSEAGFEGESFGPRWGWTYTTGCETWKDVHTGGDDRDITGRTCPSPPESPKPTPPNTGAPKPPANGSAGNSGGSAGGSSGGGSLPVTGAGLTWFIVGGTALILGGASLVVATRRKSAM